MARGRDRYDDSDSSSDDGRSRHHRSSSRRKGKSRSGSRRRDKDRERGRDRSRTPEPPARMPSPTRPKPPKLAMILLLGPDEVEFRLTEAQILYDSPNDLTSTYYADNSGEVRTYRLPDRDAAIFEIIFRYMNRETVIPLKRSLCPRYLSYEQTEDKLAEEAKFYRLTKLMRMLPPPSNMTAHGSRPPSMTGSDRSRSVSDLAPPVHMPQQSTPYPPAPLSIASTESQIPHAHPVPLVAAANPQPQIVQPTPIPPMAPVEQDALTISNSALAPSRARSSTTSAVGTVDSRKKGSVAAQTVFAYLYEAGGRSIRGHERQFPVIGYPETKPLPHLFVRAMSAEIKFSAFRNAHDNQVFELRYSIRIFDEPATRALAYRVRDSTIRAVDSHLRLNGVLTDAECRDIPMRIKHSPAALPTRQKGTISENGNVVVDDDGTFTSDCDELLELMTTKGYVKWPRIWQDTFNNVTPIDSLHQRVSLSSAEVLFDIEFPEEAAAVKEERGFQLNSEDEEELQVRNYRVNLHGIQVETRKMRRLRELDEISGRSSSKSLSHSRTPSREVKPSSSSAIYQPSLARTVETPRPSFNGDFLAAPAPSPQPQHGQRASYMSYRSDTDSLLSRNMPMGTPMSSRPPLSPAFSYRSYPASEAPSSLAGIDITKHGLYPGRPRSTASEEIKQRTMAQWG